MRTRKDANQAEIVRILKSAHLDVVDLSDVPANIKYLKDLPDLIVGGMHQEYMIPINVFVEVKDEDGDIRPGQQEFADWWRGAHVFARDADIVLKCFGIG